LPRRAISYSLISSNCTAISSRMQLKGRGSLHAPFAIVVGQWPRRHAKNQVLLVAVYVPLATFNNPLCATIQNMFSHSPLRQTRWINRTDPDKSKVTQMSAKSM
jgi:hypothetical protein